MYCYKYYVNFAQIFSRYNIVTSTVLGTNLKLEKNDL